MAAARAAQGARTIAKRLPIVITPGPKKGSSAFRDLIPQAWGIVARGYPIGLTAAGRQEVAACVVGEAGSRESPSLHSSEGRRCDIRGGREHNGREVERIKKVGPMFKGLSHGAARVDGARPSGRPGARLEIERGGRGARGPLTCHTVQQVISDAVSPGRLFPQWERTSRRSAAARLITLERAGLCYG
jgi:hypothetical protein